MSLKIFVVIYSLVPLVGSAAMYEKRGNEPVRTGATFQPYSHSYLAKPNQIFAKLNKYLIN